MLAFDRWRYYTRDISSILPAPFNAITTIQAVTSTMHTHTCFLCFLFFQSCQVQKRYQGISQATVLPVLEISAELSTIHCLTPPLLPFHLLHLRHFYFIPFRAKKRHLLIFYMSETADQLTISNGSIITTLLCLIPALFCLSETARPAYVSSILLSIHFAFSLSTY